MKSALEKANKYVYNHKGSALIVLSGITLVAIIFIVVSFYDFIQMQRYIANNHSVQGVSESKKKATTTEEVSSYNTSIFDTVSITGRAYAVFDPTLHEIIAQENSTSSYPLASVTKVMTALVAYENIPEGKEIKIIESDTLPDGVSAVKTGTVWKKDDLISYTLTVSSNDGARALARTAGEYITGTSTDPRVRFIGAMNQKAKDLGLASLVFYNEHGLDENTQMAGSYGNATDIARLLWNAYRLAAPVFESTTENSSLSVSSAGVVTAKNTNQYASHTPGLTLSKTGFTDLAHGNLGIVFETSPGRPVVIVVLHSTKEARFTDVEKLRKATLEAMK